MAKNETYSGLSFYFKGEDLRKLSEQADYVIVEAQVITAKDETGMEIGKVIVKADAFISGEPSSKFTAFGCPMPPCIPDPGKNLAPEATCIANANKQVDALTNTLKGK